MNDRIALATLYVGTGDLELELVHQIAKIQRSRHGKIDIDFLVDFHRGQRLTSPGKHEAWAGKNALSSVQMLKNVENSNCYLFKSPAMNAIEDAVLRGTAREICGVQHMKIYVFDDYSLISGANLSDTYFTNRQDRYFLIKSSELANYLQNMIKTIGKFSFKTGSKDFIQKPELSGEENFKEKIEDFVNPSKDMSFHDERNNVLIFPSFQLGSYSLNQEKNLLKDVFSNCDSEHHIQLASAYLNFPDFINDMIMQASNPTTLITANIDANGFFGAKGLKSLVPQFYESLTYTMHHSLSQSKYPEQKALHLYSRLDWSYHQKGLWISSKKNHVPFLVSIGSSNYGIRSFSRDLESSFYMISHDTEFQRKVGMEQEHIRPYLRRSVKISAPEYQRPIKIMTRFLSQYL